jgi:hypothetical protein
MVDSNVLLDVLTDDPTWGAWSQSALIQARDTGRLVINPLVYAEVSTGFEKIEDLDEAVPSADFEREALPFEAGFVADFYIGAHAAVRGYRLLTRDAPRYRTYFPTVMLVAP